MKIQFLFSMLTITIFVSAFDSRAYQQLKEHSHATKEWFSYSDLTGDHDIDNPLNYESLGGVPVYDFGPNRCAVFAEPMEAAPQYPGSFNCFAGRYKEPL